VTDLAFLEASAEIAVSVAGFISIFLALASRSERFSAAEALGIRVIVLCSVWPVFFAALPFLLSGLGISGAALWRACSALCGSVGLIASLAMTPHAREVSRLGPLPPTAQGLVSWSLTTSSLLAHAANALGWPLPPGGGVYLLGVWLVVGNATLSFVSLVFDRVLSKPPLESTSR
jgi:hypothetical protein